MKTTIDLPEELLHRAKIAAAQRRTTLKDLVLTGLDWVLRNDSNTSQREAALGRLRQGIHLGAQPLTRADTHERN